MKKRKQVDLPSLDPSNTPPPDPQEPQESGPFRPWEAVKYALAFLGLGALFFFLLVHLESSQGTARAHWLVALTYFIGGKWTVAVLFGLGSAIFFLIAFFAWRRERQ